MNTTIIETAEDENERVEVPEIAVNTTIIDYQPGNPYVRVISGVPLPTEWPNYELLASSNEGVGLWKVEWDEGGAYVKATPLSEDQIP